MGIGDAIPQNLVFLARFWCYLRYFDNKNFLIVWNRLRGATRPRMQHQNQGFFFPHPFGGEGVSTAMSVLNQV
jgi:hypothetical protein